MGIKTIWMEAGRDCLQQGLKIDCFERGENHYSVNNEVG